MALDSYLLRFQALYLADYEKLFVDQQLSNSQRYLITVCVVEARGLALKRGRAWNNSFAVVEHGSKQRFETDVASETCAPFWDQRSQL
jgi:hypothetical protein